MVIRFDDGGGLYSNTSRVYWKRTSNQQCQGTNKVLYDIGRMEGEAAEPFK